MPRKLFIVDAGNKRSIRRFVKRSPMSQTLQSSTTAAIPRAENSGIQAFPESYYVDLK
jgi:hypothetical protein